MNIPWDRIFDVLIDFIQSCIGDGFSREEIREQLQSPNPQTRRRFSSRVRRTMGYTGMRGWRRWREDREAVMGEIWQRHRGMRQNEIDELLDDAFEEWEARKGSDDTGPEPEPTER